MKLCNIDFVTGFSWQQGGGGGIAAAIGVTSNFTGSAKMKKHYILLGSKYNGMNFVFGMSIHLKREVAWYGATYKRRLLKGVGSGPTKSWWKETKIGKAKSDEKRQGEGVLNSEKWADAVYGWPLWIWASFIWMLA